MAVDSTSALDAALSYSVIGWPIFPCGPDKKPLVKDWPHVATTDRDTIIAWWRKWPTAQVSVDCDRAGLAVVDLDLSDEKDGISALAAFLGTEPHGCQLIATTPRGGRHLVYARPIGSMIRNGVDVLGEKTGVDVRASGGYIVLPSPVSPGREWRVGDPYDVDELGKPCDLVEPPDVMMQIMRPRSAAENAVGREPLPQAKVQLLDEAQVAEIRDALGAISNTPRDSWIRVAMALRSTGAGSQAFDLWVEWARKRPDGGEGDHPKFDMSVHRKQWASLRERFADGSEITLASLFRLAQEGGWIPATRFCDQAAGASHSDTMAQLGVDKFPLRLLDECPGLIGSIGQWLLAASLRRQPALCLGSAIATVGAILGRRVELGSLRTNVYCLGIAETGAGKDIGIRGPMELLALAGLQRLVGPSIWKSDAGLRQALVREPSHVCLIDEFTQFLRVSAGGPGQIPPHIAGIKTHLLEFYSAASSIHVAAAYADEKHQPPPILEPNLCIYGVGTPRDLGASFTRGAMSDGFLNRWLVFFSDEALPPAQQSPTRKPPIALVAAVRALEERTRPVAAGGMSLVGAGGSTTATGTGCRQIEVTTEAVARLNAIGEECDCGSGGRATHRRRRGGPHQRGR